MFLDITFILLLVALLAILAKIFRQPIILAYILTGIIVGPLGLSDNGSHEVLQTFGELGITLLLFVLGLELRFKELKLVGKVIIAVGILQMLVVLGTGYLWTRIMGFSGLSAIYISLAVTFSSTVFLLKLLSDKRETQSLYGKIAIGISLIQDFFAILVLIFLPGIGQTRIFSDYFFQGIEVLGKAVLLFGVIYLLSRNVMPKIVSIISRSSEILFLFSLAWVFGLSAFVSSPLIGFSQEIGGFLAGIALANAIENTQIAVRLKPLRDFFITIFFVLIGVQMSFGNFFSLLFPAILLSYFVLIWKPFLTAMMVGLLGYRKKTSLLVGFTTAQISEFSFVLLFLGERLRQIPEQVVSLVALVGLITFTISSYMIIYGSSISKILSNIIFIFEKKGGIELNLAEKKETRDHIVLVGVRRMGQSILGAIMRKGEPVAVVDFDPDIIKNISEKGIIYVFGDIAEKDIQELAGIEKARLVISTISDITVNKSLLKAIGRMNAREKHIKTIFTAQDAYDAKLLYEMGAGYVVLPHVSGGAHVASLLNEAEFSKPEY